MLKVKIVCRVLKNCKKGSSKKTLRVLRYVEIAITAAFSEVFR
jgi:hypothetical protein